MMINLGMGSVLVALALLASVVLLLAHHKQSVKRRQLRLLSEVFAENPAHELSLAQRHREAIGSSDFVYGEIHYYSLLDVLAIANLEPGNTFVDLGSGSGFAVLTAAIHYPQCLCVGVELLSSLHELSQQMQQAVLKHRFAPRSLAVQWEKGDYLQYDLHSADVVYCNAAALSESSWAQLIERFQQQLRPGARIITVSKRLKSSEFTVLGDGLWPMSWGWASVFVYQRQ